MHCHFHDGVSQLRLSLACHLPLLLPFAGTCPCLQALLLEGTEVQELLLGELPCGACLRAAAPALKRRSPMSRTSRIPFLAARGDSRHPTTAWPSLAALAWFVHPLLFIAASLLVIAVLYRRDFRSRSLVSMQRLLAAGD